MKPPNFVSIEWNLKHLYNEVRDKNDPNVTVVVLDKRKALILTAIREVVDNNHPTLSDYRNAMNDIDKLLKMITF